MIKHVTISKEDLSALISLMYTKGLNNTHISSLLQLFESPSSAWECTDQQWHDALKIPIEKIERPKQKTVNETIHILKTSNAHPIWFGHALYPNLFAELSDPPAAIFYRGNRDLLQNEMIAMVGTRKASYEAIRWTSEIAENLTQQQYTIISGGAVGIDDAALKGALQAQGKPVVVSGVPINQLYPKDTEKLQKEIIEQGGLIISEMLPESPMHKGRFLERNRLIAALAKAIIVSSAPMQSGALSTARWGRRLNKHVLVVPMSPWEMASEGNRMLLEEGAFPIHNVKDIFRCIKDDKLLSSYECQKDSKSMRLCRMLDMLNDQEIKIVKTLRKGKAYPEEIIERSGITISIAELQTILLDLELRGVILKHYGGCYLLNL